MQIAAMIHLVVVDNREMASMIRVLSTRSADDDSEQTTVRPTMSFAVDRPECYQLIGRVPLDLRVVISPQTGTKHHPHKFRPRQFRDIPHPPMLFIQSDGGHNLFGNGRHVRVGRFSVQIKLHIHRSGLTSSWTKRCDRRVYTAVRAARS